jgi:hypothetical protein
LKLGTSETLKAVKEYESQQFKELAIRLTDNILKAR